MAISGYSATTALTGSTTGALIGDLQSVTVGGVTLDFSEVKEVDDTNRIPTNLPMTVREAPMEVVMTYVKTLYDAARDAVKAQTSETWTLTDAGSSTHIGTGYISGVSGLNLDTDGHAAYTITITPATTWAFTA